MMKLSRPQYGLEQEIVQVIYALREKKSSELFRQPVDPVKVPDYYEIIQKPMDLTKMQNKLKQGEYKYSQEIHQDFQLIVNNCLRYNRVDQILKKAEQFRECITTVWGNFKKDIAKKGISYQKKITINEEILMRIGAIDEKRTKKKVIALQTVIQQEKKNILHEAHMRLPMMEFDKAEKEELPGEFLFDQNLYREIDRESKDRLINFELNCEEIVGEFQKIAEKKLKKYKKILKKRLIWFDEKIIKKCLGRKNFQKMLIPKHLHSFIEGGVIAQELSIRKLQMYIKKITYWVEDNSNILSDYMKDRFVQNCKIMKRCIFRVIKYKRNQKNRVFTDLKGEQGQGIVQRDNDNYENKMKQFKRMLQKDRQKSTKRDTKIILRNENGILVFFDWIRKPNAQVSRKPALNKNNIQPLTNDQKYKEEEQKRQLRKDQQFMHNYCKKSNVLLVDKYRQKLAMNWEYVRHSKMEYKDINLSGTDDDL